MSMVIAMLCIEFVKELTERTITAIYFRLLRTPIPLAFIVEVEFALSYHMHHMHYIGYEDQLSVDVRVEAESEGKCFTKGERVTCNDIQYNADESHVRNNNALHSTFTKDVTLENS